MKKKVAYMGKDIGVITLDKNSIFCNTQELKALMAEIASLHPEDDAAMLFENAANYLGGLFEVFQD